ncbi:MAG: transposase [bacterium]|nr:MAG: transposase [bacterium]
MARPIRLQFPGAIYHISARGNRGEDIFIDDSDRTLFLKLLADNAKRLNWLCHAYCLMDNHYHLLLETPEGILSGGMRHLNSVYAGRFNRRYGQAGHVFQGRFTARLIDGTGDLLSTARYICRNPVEAKVVDDAADWRWSSYRATVGKERAPEFLTTDLVLNCLSTRHSLAREFFSRLVHTDLGKNCERMPDFIRQMSTDPTLSNRLRPIIDMRQSSGSVQRKQRILSRPPLENLFMGLDAGQREQRDAVIRDAFRHYGYRQTEIGRFLNLDRSTISRIVNKTD